MPYVNIKITEEAVTNEQKNKLIAGVTSLLQETLGKNPKTTMVIIDEINIDNWGLAGLSVRDYREVLAKQPA
ncbi:2-hydroxymuconate tautomerase family protein [Trinickia dinghuensis]|uniref:Tautomerase n=1 Tax=Trinickia dinghuensis TaxID=2291023 RepID=A0A3D8K5Q3_9BURK|nr:4-oxalocrotonate tautomerase family protein [Trinickia dinghuensis]RDV00639.1 4-oxalocrotonate tautomerase family protein [Trinickia dinghuensis]